MNANLIDKVAYLKLVDGQILSTRSKGRSKYYIPGGKREGTESDEETLIREIKEELNVDIDPASIQYRGTFIAQADREKIGVEVKMTCYSANYSGLLKASSEIEEIRWLTFKDLDIISPVDQIIFQFLKDKGELR